MAIAQKPRFLDYRKVLASIAALLAAAAVLAVLASSVSDSVEERSIKIAKDAINRALVTCYAAEGSYPPSLDHLEEKYAVVIDDDAYLVYYQVFASNVMPEVTIVSRRAGR